MGLMVNDSIAGHRAIHHGGDIPGFSSNLAWLPDDSMTVAVLTAAAPAAKATMSLHLRMGVGGSVQGKIGGEARGSAPTSDSRHGPGRSASQLRRS